MVPGFLTINNATSKISEIRNKVNQNANRNKDSPAELVAIFLTENQVMRAEQKREREHKWKELGKRSRTKTNNR